MLLYLSPPRGIYAIDVRGYPLKYSNIATFSINNARVIFPPLVFDAELLFPRELWKRGQAFVFFCSVEGGLLCARARFLYIKHLLELFEIFFPVYISRESFHNRITKACSLTATADTHRAYIIQPKRENNLDARSGISERSRAREPMFRCGGPAASLHYEFEIGCADARTKARTV